jgi:hypothetical protein
MDDSFRVSRVECVSNFDRQIEQKPSQRDFPRCDASASCPPEIPWR